MFHVRLLITAILGLRQNFLRTLLATLGVVIGVGAVVSAVSILEGAQKDILDSFQSLGADQILVFNGSEQRQHRAVQINSLELADAAAIEEDYPEMIIATAPEYQGFGQVKYLERNSVAAVLGTTPDYSHMNDYRTVDGRFISEADVLSGSMVCVLGHKVAHDLFGERPAVDRTVRIQNRSFTVVGVMEEKGALGFVEVDSQVIIPVSTAMDRIFGSRYLTKLAAQCRTARELPECIDLVKRSLRKSHRIRAGDRDDFMVFTQERIKQQFASAAAIFAVVLYSIAGISLVVGGIGIMNIMLVSVTERTREIGVRIAVGARRFDILEQFLVEASIISMLGGGLGIICGWAIANFLGEFTEVLTPYTPPLSIVLALAMAIAVGIISGIYPAIRAARLDPVEALRYE